jgi:hypothetical protein
MPYASVKLNWSQLVPACHSFINTPQQKNKIYGQNRAKKLVNYKVYGINISKSHLMECDEVCK